MEKKKKKENMLTLISSLTECCKTDTSVKITHKYMKCVNNKKTGSRRRIGKFMQKWRKEKKRGSFWGRTYTKSLRPPLLV